MLSCLPYAIYWLYSQAIGAFADKSFAITGVWFVVAALLMSLISDLVRTKSSLLDRLFYHRLQAFLSPEYYARKGGLGIDMLEDQRFHDVMTKAEDRSIWPIMNIAVLQFENLSNFCRLMCALGVVVMYDWHLCALVVVSLIPQFLVDVRHGTTLWTIWDAETDTRRHYNEILRHFRNRYYLAELKLFQNVPFFIDRMRSMLNGFKESQEIAERKKYVWAGLAVAMSSVLLGTTLVIMALKVVHDTLTLQGFVFLWTSFGGLHSTLSGALRSIAQQNEWAMYAEDNYAVMDAEPESSRRSGTLVCSNRVPEIVFDHVSFHYPWDNPERLILTDVSFRIRPGEHVALAGVNGAGKTTLIKLLCGFYEPTSGRILIDGVSLRDLNIESWRQQVAILFQEYATYHLKVADVIRLGDTCSPVDHKRLEAAAKASGVASFCADLPNGYDTMIGKDFAGGIDLSGGQNQRMALARIWYRRGKVIILDEPTASLDAFSEAQIFEEIEQRRNGETVILITHRFSSVKTVDHIVVLDKGRVVENGNHASLMEHNGLYAEMFLKQARGYMTQPIKPLVEEE